MMENECIFIMPHITKREKLVKFPKHFTNAFRGKIYMHMGRWETHAWHGTIWVWRWATRLLSERLEALMHESPCGLEHWMHVAHRGYMNVLTWFFFLSLSTYIFELIYLIQKISKNLNKLKKLYFLNIHKINTFSILEH